MRKNLKILILFVAVFVCCSVGSVSFMAKADNALQNPVSFDFAFDMESEYALGETVRFPEAEIVEEGKGKDYFITLFHGNDLIATFAPNTGFSYKLDKTGNYSAVYCANLSDGTMSTKYFDFICKEMPFIEVPQIPASIGYFEEIEIGKGVLLAGNERVEAKCVVISPDGVRKEFVGGKFSPDFTGQYTFEFSAENDEKAYVKSVFMQVNLSAENLIENVGNITSLRKNADYPSYAKENNGIEVLGKGGSPTFRFKNIIDLEKISDTDDLVEFIVLNGERYTSFSGSTYVSLIDAYDPDNVVTIRIIPANGIAGYSYVTVSFGGSYFGLSNENGIVWKDNVNGFGFVSNAGYDTSSSKPFRFHYDTKTNSVMSHNGISWGTGSQVVIDLDDPMHVGPDVFKGFTDNKIYLQVSYPSLNGEGGVIVSEIAGMSLGGNSLSDKTGPILSIEGMTEVENVLPYGVAKKEYLFPKATAYDTFSAESSVQLEVKFGDELFTVSDGAFTPQEAGEYEVFYKAKDAFGNESVRKFSLAILDRAEQIEVSFSQMPENLVAGEYLTLPELVIEGASGSAVYETEALLNGKTAEPNEKGEYFLFESGEFKLIVTVKDYLGNQAVKELALEIGMPKKASVTVLGISDAVKVGDKFLPAIFSVTDYGLSDETDNTYKAMFVNGKKADYTEGYVVKENDGEYLDVDFIGGRGERENIVRYRVKVIKSDDLANYFITEGNPKIDISRDGSGFSSATPFSVKMPFKIIADDLQMNIIVDSEKNNFDYFDIVMQDYIDGQNSIFLRISKYTDTQSYLQINGIGMKFVVQGSFYDESSAIVLRYDNEYRQITTESGSAITSIDYTASGNSFQGFGSDFVRLTMRTEEQHGEVRLILARIGNQSLNDLAFRLNVGPQLSYGISMQNITIVKGESFVVSSAVAGDVLDYYSAVSLRVIDPEGKVVFVGDCRENRTFVGQKYGVYIIEYTAVDASGNETLERFNAVVEDRTPPEIIVSGNMPNTVKLGKSISIPVASITDNLDTAPQLYCYVYSDDDMHYVAVEMGGEYKPDKAGDYRLIYYGFDATYNVAHYEICFTVTA